MSPPDAPWARIGILFGPSDVDKRGEQPVCAALGKGQPFGNSPERHLPRAIGQELDNRQAAFGRYVGHVGSVDARLIETAARRWNAIPTRARRQGRAG